MEIIQCEIKGETGFKCGESGVCHTGIDGKQKAFRDQKRIKALEFEKKPAPLPQTRLEREEENN
ncbi:MAG: hypothetical protein V4549_03670 [Bacteroidota bacterium]